MVASTYSIKSFLLELEPTSVLSASSGATNLLYWNGNLPPAYGATGLLLELELLAASFWCNRPPTKTRTCCTDIELGANEPASGATRAGTGCCDIELAILASLWCNQPATGTSLTCCAVILSLL
ncbi:unnamed protein product [Sphagnum balticum]